MANISPMKYDARVDDNNLEVVVFVPQSVPKPGTGKAKFHLVSLGASRLQTRKELLDNGTAAKAAGRVQVPVNSSRQAGENLSANGKLIPPRNSVRHMNLARNNNPNFIPDYPCHESRLANYPSTEEQVGRNAFALERLRLGVSVANLQHAAVSRPGGNYQDIERLHAGADVGHYQDVERLHPAANRINFREMERLCVETSISNFQDQKPRVGLMVTNNDKPAYVGLQPLMPQYETQNLRSFYDEDDMMSIRQAEHQYFRNYPENIQLENPQDKYDFQNFRSGDKRASAPWQVRSLQFPRISRLNPPTATRSSEARPINNLPLVPSISIPQSVNISSYWQGEPVAAKNMPMHQQHLGLQNRHIQQNNLNQFQEKKQYRRRRGARVQVHHTQFGLQTPLRKKMKQNRTLLPRDGMNNTGPAGFNGQRRGNRIVSY